MAKVYIPASSANMSAGSDVLGAAVTPIDGVSFGDIVTTEMAEAFSLNNLRRFIDKLPSELRENITYQCQGRFCQGPGKQTPVVMTLEKNMPTGPGLGSSACPAVTVLVAVNERCGKPLNDTRLLALMSKLGGRIPGGVYYNSVAPCSPDGMQLMIEENDITSQQAPGFGGWLWVLVYPGIRVSTVGARVILPAQYRRQDCIAYGRHLADFIHVYYSRQPELVTKLMRDVVVEPYCERLLSGFRQARQVVAEIGAVVGGISGSGPTLFTLCDKPDTAQRITDWLGKNCLQNQEGFVHICRLDTTGVRILGN